jgi:hypothetical protein
VLIKVCIKFAKIIFEKCSQVKKKSHNHPVLILEKIPILDTTIKKKTNKVNSKYQVTINFCYVGTIFYVDIPDF